MGLRKISRETGLSRNTVVKWLRDPSYVEKLYGVSINPSSTRAPDESPVINKDNSDAEDLPAGWDSWDQVRDARKLIKGVKYALAMKDLNSNAKKKAQIDDLLKTPLGEKIAIIRAFSDGWYSIWPDQSMKRDVDVAKAHWDSFASNSDFHSLKALAKFQQKLSDEQFQKLSSYMTNDTWETTSNGAERYNRKFRKFQKARYNLRTEETISNSLRKMATEKYAKRCNHQAEFSKAA